MVFGLFCWDSICMIHGVSDDILIFILRGASTVCMMDRFLSFLFSPLPAGF